MADRPRRDGGAGLDRDRGAGVVTGPILFLCAVAAIADGDTLRCDDGRRVRLAAIEAPESRCLSRAGRWYRCPGEAGEQGRRTLERLIGGRGLDCEAVGASYGRTVAWCSAGGLDLSCAMVAAGAARAVPRFDPQGRLGRCPVPD